MPTIREVLRAITTQLESSSTPRLDAQVLLCHLLGVEKPYLIAHDDHVLTEHDVSQLAEMVRRRASGEPIAYIVGHKNFYGLDFIVTSNVLVPRPETEHLVEEALAWTGNKPNRVAADIGTGSGAIAITVKQRAPHIIMHAVDISSSALSVAQANATTHRTEIVWHQGSLAQPLQQDGIKVDLLLANLPYIPTANLLQLAVSQHEPSLALDGGTDGLDLVRKLLQQVPSVCNPGALILLEIGAEQGEATLAIASQQLNLAAADVLQDLAGLDRVVRLQLTV